MGRAGATRATLDDELLSRAFGADEVLITFDLAGWMQVGGIARGVEVLVSGAAPGETEPRPLMLLFQPEPGGGQVAYTSFHTSAQAEETLDALIRALLLRL